MSAPTKAPTYPTIDPASLDALLDAREKKKAEKERLEKIRANPKFADEETIVIRVHDLPVPVENVLRPGPLADPKDVFGFPPGARISKGVAFRQPVGFVKNELGTGLFREPNAGEDVGVLAQTAAAFVVEDGRASNAAALLDAAERERLRRISAVEKARAALAEAERSLADGAGIVAAAQRHADAEQKSRAEWIAGSGHSEEALLAAAELLLRKDQSETATRARAHFPPGSRQPEPWRERIDRLNREEAEAAS